MFTTLGPTLVGKEVKPNSSAGESIMSNTTVRAKIAAMCNGCKSVFASELRSDGSIRPIGTKRGCPCGGTDFRRLE